MHLCLMQTCLIIRGLEKQHGIIAMINKEDISRGSPVYDSYGKKCNSRFFLNYGFINLNNDGNEVNLKI